MTQIIIICNISGLRMYMVIGKIFAENRSTAERVV